MITVGEHNLYEMKFLVEIEEDQELRFLFNAVQELMRDIAIELPRMELTPKYN